MPFLLYVENYPTNFNEDELLFLFRDFTVRVERMIYQGPKTYAFVTCKDINHAKLIIKTLNGTDICGRKLVIQPHKDRQAYMHVFPKEGNCKSERSEAAYVKHLYDQQVKKALSVSSLELKQASSDRKSCDTELLDSCLSVKPNQNIHCEKMACGNASNDQETVDKKNSVPSKSSQSVDQKAIDENQSHWVRVTHFPIGTCENILYNLFQHYNPKDVKMICNKPRVDGRVTEALISFPSEDAVFEVVSKYDHTYFWGRIISVEGLSDHSLSAELMDMHLQ